MFILDIFILHTEFICNVAISTGVVLDATYTGKAAYHLVKQLQENPERFKGRKILFVHTGKMEYHVPIMLRSKTLRASKFLS